jgi:hypothetical protein
MVLSEVESFIRDHPVMSKKLLSALLMAEHTSTHYFGELEFDLEALVLLGEVIKVPISI